MTRALDTGIGNEIKPRIDLVGGAYRVKAYVLGCNTAVGRVE